MSHRAIETRRYDAVMNVKDMNLLFMPIDTGKTASGRALTVLNLTRASGDSYRYHVAQREGYAAVRAHYHSNEKGKRKSVIVGGDNNRNVKVLPEELRNGSRSASGRRNGVRPHAAQSGDPVLFARARPA